MKLEELDLSLAEERVLKMPKCVYCGKLYGVPRGLTLVMKDGTINYLCSSKCRKNMAMKRRIQPTNQYLQRSIIYSPQPYNLLFLQ